MPVEDHLWIIHHPMEQILESNVEAQFNEIVKELQKWLVRCSSEKGVDILQLDVFSAVVVNRMENEVFIYRKSTSFL